MLSIFFSHSAPSSCPQTIFQVSSEKCEKTRKKICDEKITYLQVLLRQATFQWSSDYPTTVETSPPRKTIEQICILSIIIFITFPVVLAFNLVTGCHFLIHMSNKLNERYNFLTNGMEGICERDFKMWLYDQYITQDSYKHILHHQIPIAVMVPHMRGGIQDRFKILWTRTKIESYLRNLVQMLDSIEDDEDVRCILAIISEAIMNQYHLDSFESGCFLSQMKMFGDIVQVKRMIQREVTSIELIQDYSFHCLLKNMEEEVDRRAQKIIADLHEPSLYTYVYHTMLQRILASPWMTQKIEIFNDLLTKKLQEQSFMLLKQYCFDVTERDCSSKEDFVYMCLLLNNPQLLLPFQEEEAEKQKELCAAKKLLLLCEGVMHIPSIYSRSYELREIVAKLQTIINNHCQTTTVMVLTPEQSIDLFRTFLGTDNSSGFPTLLGEFMHFLEGQGDLDEQTNTFHSLGIDKGEIEKILEDTDCNIDGIRLKKFKSDIDRDALLAQISNGIDM